MGPCGGWAGDYWQRCLDPHPACRAFRSALSPLPPAVVARLVALRPALPVALRPALPVALRPALPCSPSTLAVTAVRRRP